MRMPDRSKAQQGTPWFMIMGLTALAVALLIVGLKLRKPAVNATTGTHVAAPATEPVTGETAPTTESPPGSMRNM